MFRKPLFWVVFFLVSAGCVLFTSRFFSEAFPIVTLDLRMDREAALAKARDLAQRFQFPPRDYDQVASFEGDQEVQNFVELEGGGTGAFQKMLSEGLYQSYQWTVRLYRPGETRETRVVFTPEGSPYGFRVKLPEDEPGVVLPADRAQEIAEQSASRDWKISFSKYRLVEKSREVRPGGRVDHTLVYERPDVRVGEGKYRLRLVVSGDRLTELTPFVKVPEAFSRRYENMRSANNVIGASGTVALFLLYIVGGCGLGLFFLLRKRWILWRAPLYWGIFIAFLQMLAGLNQWPLLWMNYDTAVSAQGFAARQIMVILLEFVLNAALFSVSFMSAESLSRKAFPRHIQQWRLWSREVAPSKALLGRTFGGYLLVGAFFAYEVALYFFTTRTLGWWSPSDVLVQPDILSTHFPWLTSIAVSAQAGFWEESLFRAVPIAGAALLGDRFGKRGWWIGGAMILQALIFGSGHAGYANQPAYARVVELIIPALMFGLLYLYFGLLVGIVLHFTFDVTWFALPLFVSTAPGIWVDRVMVFVLVLTPLWVLLVRRLRAGEWRQVPIACLNGSWRPAEPKAPEVVTAPPTQGAMRWGVARSLPFMGLVGLMLWLFTGSFTSDAPPLMVTRTEAKVLAQKALLDHGVRPSSWEPLTVLHSQPEMQDRFVWQTAGEKTYRALMGSYLAPPHWQVRFVRFEGDVAQRAEEYQVFVAGNEGAFRFSHVLPEDRSGKRITEDEARGLAYQALTETYRIDPAKLKEISAVPSNLRARTDWTFTFGDPAGVRLPEGEKRIAVGIAGDQIADIHRFVHVPEDWRRQEREKATIGSIISACSSLLIVLPLVAGLVGAIVSWSRKRFVVSTFLWLFSVLLVINSVNLLNSIPGITASFSTAQPYKIQLFIMLAVGVMVVLLVAGSTALAAGLVHWWHKDASQRTVPSEWSAGAAVGCFAAGIFSICSALGPSLSPVWGDYGPLASYVPWLDSPLGSVAAYLTQSTVLLLIVVAANRFTRGWTQRRWLFGSLLFLYGFALAGNQFGQTLLSWFVTGIILGGLLFGLYVMVLRHSVTAVLTAIGVLPIMRVLRQEMYEVVPNVEWSATIAIACVALAVWLWHRKFARRREAAVQLEVPLV